MWAARRYQSRSVVFQSCLRLFLGIVKMSTEGEDVKGTEEATTEEQQVRVYENTNVKN